MLKSIKLQNWRSHRSTALRFARGTNLLVGRMGGGKTSIVDAICYALFGTCPPIAQRRITTQELIRARPNGEAAACIELTFDKDGEEYTVTRAIRKGGAARAEIRRNGSAVQGPRPRDVDRYITELLDVDSDLFMRAVYSQQNAIDYLLTLSPGERKAKIDELLGLTKFERARKNAASAARRLDEIRGDLEKTIASANVEKIMAELAELKSALARAKENEKEKERRVREAEAQVQRAEKKFLQLSAQRVKFAELNQKELKLKHSITMLKEELEKIDVGKKDELERSLKVIEKEKHNLQRELNNIEMEIEKQINAQSSAQAKFFEAEKNLKKKRDAEGELQKILDGKTLKALDAEYSNLKNEIAELTLCRAQALANLRTLNLAVEELKKELAKCPICSASLTSELREKLLSEKRTALATEKVKIREIEEQLEGRTCKLATYEEKIKEAKGLDAVLKELKDVEKDISELRAKLNEHFVRINKLRKDKESLQLKMENVRAAYNEIEKQLSKIYDGIEKKKSLEALTKELQQVEVALSEISFDEQQWESAQREYNDAKVEQAKAVSELQIVQREIRYIEEKISDRAARIEEINEHIETVQRCERLAEKLQRFANALADVQVELRAISLDEINGALQEIWPIIYPYSDYSGLRIVPTEDDYLLQLKVGSEYVQVDGIASGGERALACLALRIALALVLTPQLGWIILDEPTHNLDEEAVRALATTLRDHVPKILEQAIVITHDEGLKDAASEKIFRFDRDKEIPEITIVEEM